MCDCALAYARLGMAVFPVWPGESKNPLTAHGFKDATTDEATIRAWWRKWPHAEIAWAVTPDFVVVDLDEKHGHHGLDDFLMREGVHPLDVDTPIATSPTGGAHLYFATCGEKFQNKTNIAGTGIDLRTIGGYVVTPGANNGRTWLKGLEWPVLPAPAWVPRAPIYEPHEVGEASEFRGETAYARAALRRAVQAIRGARCGSQESTLNRECFSIGTMVGAGDLDAEPTLKALLSAANAMTAHTTPWGDLTTKVTRILEQGRAKPRKLKGERP
jgi:hypothetical protein